MIEAPKKMAGWRTWRSKGFGIAAAERLGSYESNERAARMLFAAERECNALPVRRAKDAWAWLQVGRFSPRR